MSLSSIFFNFPFSVTSSLLILQKIAKVCNIAINVYIICCNNVIDQKHSFKVLNEQFFFYWIGLKLLVNFSLSIFNLQ